jgi:hypothetical protein
MDTKSDQNKRRTTIDFEKLRSGSNFSQLPDNQIFGSTPFIKLMTVLDLMRSVLDR